MTLLTFSQNMKGFSDCSKSSLKPQARSVNMQTANACSQDRTACVAASKSEDILVRQCFESRQISDGFFAFRRHVRTAHPEQNMPQSRYYRPRKIHIEQSLRKRTELEIRDVVGFANLKLIILAHHDDQKQVSVSRA